MRDGGGGGGWGEKTADGMLWHMTDGKREWTEFQKIDWSAVQTVRPGDTVIIRYSLPNAEHN